MATKITKVQFSSFGPPSVVELVTDELPPPPASNLQVKVLYSSFSGTDINMRNGTYPMQRKAPMTPGYALVGRVVSNGAGASKFPTGTIVASLTVYDAEATFANVPEKYCLAVPAGMDLKVACALIVDWTTAYGMVYRTAKVKAGDKVFIHGLSGAVGQALMRLCKLEGAEIYGTASTRNHKELESLGATAYDYRSKDWIKAMQEKGGVQAVFDPLGFESWDESWTVLSTDVHSVLVGYGGNLQTLNENQEPRSQMWATAKLLMKNGCWSERSTRFFYIDRDQSTYWPELRTLFELVEKQKIEVPIKKVLKGLEEVPSAHENWTKLEGMGSCVIEIN